MNIGLLVSELEDKEVKRICIGACQAANDKDVSLVIMPGKYLMDGKNEDTDNLYKYQYAALFDYANSSDFDAIVIDIERIGKNVAILKKEAFLNKFDKVPVLTLTEQEGFNGVNEVETDHDKLEQLGYEAVCDAVFYAKNSALPPLEAQKKFSYVERPEQEALDILSELQSILFHQKYESEKIYKAFTDRATKFGVKNGGILIYDKKVRNTIKYPWEKPENIGIKCAVINGTTADFKNEGLAIATDKILSSYPGNKNRILIAGNIFVGEYQLGLVFTEFNERLLIDHYFDSLLSLVTGVARLSYLERQLSKTNEELYEVQEELARDDSVLDHIGDQDYLTGGLNRRGFFAKAYDLLKDNFKQGSYAVVAYIHMESLKSINEMYGHEEGDRAVKKVADILKGVFDNSICGRIRGDEFAVIEIAKEEGKAEALRQEMSAQNAKLLTESSRYINHLQYSICEFGHEENLSLREMLKETDENLQRIKGNM